MRCVFLVHLLDQAYILGTWKGWVQALPGLYWKLVNGSLSRLMPIRWPVRSFWIDLPGKERVEGRVLSTWLHPAHMLQDQRAALERIKRACEVAREWGASIVGLGGLNGVIGMRGEAVRDEVDVALTNGNHLIIPTAVEQVEEVLRALDAHIETEEMVVVGFPGLHGPHIARLMVRRGARRLTLVARSRTLAVHRLISELESVEGTRVRLADDLRQGLRMGRLVVSSTGTGGLIPQEDLLAGTVLINANVLRDVRGVKAEREDVLILDGGVVKLPKDARMKGNLFGLGEGLIYSCLAEVILSGLEKPGESYSLGRVIDPAKVETMRELTRSYGLRPACFLSFAQPVSPHQIAKIREIRKNRPCL